MTKTKLTHQGTRRSTFVQIAGAEFYYSQPINSKKGSSFINISGSDPVTGQRRKVRLSAREINTLRKLITA
jgi:hypothetical protein